MTSLVIASGKGRTALCSVSIAILVFALHGCGGGSGNGGSEVSMEKGLPVRCLNKPEPGPCEKRVNRYFYDYRSDRCRVFQYGGCAGRVPFETLEACRETCEGGGR